MTAAQFIEIFFPITHFEMLARIGLYVSLVELTDEARNWGLATVAAHAERARAEVVHFA